MNNWNRKQRAAAGRETANILESKHYVCDGKQIDITQVLATAVAETESYPPERAIERAPERQGYSNGSLRVEVINDTTLAAARRMSTDSVVPLALNFASAKNPGGGFLSGARAQEESLATKSGLYACLVGNPMYAHHRALRDAMYSPYAIYSPRVPVIRDEQGDFIEPWLCSFITSPAPNAGAVLRKAPQRQAELEVQLELRIERVLAIAAAHAHRHLVLGAWGCGVFGNDTSLVANLFGAALEGRFAGSFEHVVFAVLDSSADERFIGAFRALASST